MATWYITVGPLLHTYMHIRFWTGKGTYVSANGDKYQGEYANGHKHGYGITSWTNGSRHEVYASFIVFYGAPRLQNSDAQVQHAL
jgi:hypothetical protein